MCSTAMVKNVNYGIPRQPVLILLHKLPLLYNQIEIFTKPNKESLIQSIHIELQLVKYGIVILCKVLSTIEMVDLI